MMVIGEFADFLNGNVSSVESLLFIEAVDDTYFSALVSEEEVFPIADEKYAESLQFQEVLFVSSSVPSTGHSGSQSSGVTEKHSSSSSFIACTICAEEALRPEDMFRGKMSCSHIFCNSCIARHVAAKVQENNISSLSCPEPGCRAPLQPEHCRGVVPDQVFTRWCDVLCESLVLGSSTQAEMSSWPSGVLYCPFSDCSAPLLTDSDESLIRVECPSCHRLFCARCKVPWHATAAVELTCDEFRQPDKVKKLDLMLVDLAEANKWKRCPNCSFFIEKKEGCAHITCRCKFEFCYGCGSGWTSSHQCPP